MSALDPKALFKWIARDIPRPLRKHMIVVGSLAAAYRFRTSLKSQAVNTKDADVVVYPAGDIKSCVELAKRLLALGWRRTDKCHPMPRPVPVDKLRAIRLHPPASTRYFIELMGLPKRSQKAFKKWTAVRLDDGWYGIPSFRFMALLAEERCATPEGIDYAHPGMMALANLLSHRKVGSDRMSDAIGGRSILRSAKDLGRVLALAWLGGRKETQSWLAPWRKGLKKCFGASGAGIAHSAGEGLRELLDTPSAMDEARHTTEVGLLNGKRVTVANLEAIGRQLLADVIDPLAATRGSS